MSAGVSPVSAIPNEILVIMMLRLPALELIRVGAVCRLWRQASERICEIRFRQEYCGQLLLTPPRALESGRARFAFNGAVCKARGKCWERQETHPLNLWAIKKFIKPGETDIVCHALEAPVDFEETTVQTYLVQCGVKARVVHLPLITPRESSDPCALMDFPTVLGAILQIVKAEDCFFVLAGDRIYAVSQNLASVRILADIPNGTSLTYNYGYLIAGTREGKLIGWRVDESLTMHPAFIHQFSEGSLTWLALYSEEKKTVILAIQRDVLLILRDLSVQPRIKKISLGIAEGHRPFFHHSHLIWKSKELGYISINLENNDWQHSFLDWFFASPVSGGKLLVQDSSHRILLFDENLQGIQIGSCPISFQAADLRDDFLLAASKTSSVYLYRLDEEMRLIYENHGKTVEGERIIKARLNAARTFVLGTNNGRFIYGSPVFEGLSFAKETTVWDRRCQLL